jgi:general secretion pathway protein A
MPFDARALKRIYQLTRGVPRRINLLCGRALLGAWANGQARVDKAVVNRAAQEVFGPDAAQPSDWLARHRPAVAGTLAAVLAAATLAMWSQWRGADHTVVVPALAKTTPPIEVPATSRADAMQPIQPARHEDGASLLSMLPQDINVAWQELGSVWQLPPLPGSPCSAVELKPWQCHQVEKLTLPQLRQLGRPGVLTLQTDKGAAVYAVLVGLSEHTATLQIEGKQHAIDTLSLGKLWQGDFATYWKPPAGYTPKLIGKQAAPAIAELIQQLAQLEGGTRSAMPASAPVLDAGVTERVRAFQRAQGLTPDGLPGPLTFMQMEQATGQTHPRLLTQAR